MRFERRRTGKNGIHEVLSTVSMALRWNASEIHVFPDRFEVVMKGEPTKDPSSMTLSELIRTTSVHAIKINGSFVRCLQAVFDLCLQKRMYLIRVYAWDVKGMMDAEGLSTKESSVMGVPIEQDRDILQEGDVVFAVSSVPFAPIAAASTLLKGNLHG